MSSSPGYMNRFLTGTKAISPLDGIRNDHDLKRLDRTSVIRGRLLLDKVQRRFAELISFCALSAIQSADKPGTGVGSSPHDTVEAATARKYGGLLLKSLSACDSEERVDLLRTVYDGAVVLGDNELIWVSLTKLHETVLDQRLYVDGQFDWTFHAYALYMVLQFRGNDFGLELAKLSSTLVRHRDDSNQSEATKIDEWLQFLSQLVSSSVTNPRCLLLRMHGKEVFGPHWRALLSLFRQDVFDSLRKAVRRIDDATMEAICSDVPAVREGS